MTADDEARGGRAGDPSPPRTTGRDALDALEAEARRADGRLLRLAARADLRRPDSPRWTDAALVARVAARVASESDASPALDEAAVRAAAERLRARAWARRLGVADGEERPRLRSASRAAPCAHALELAAAERCAPRLDLAIAAGSGRALWDEACDEWVALPAGMPAGRYLALGVSGESMLPLLHPHDVVLVRVTSGPPVPESVVVARRPDDGYVVKRVARVTARWVELASLNPAYGSLRVPNRPGVVLGSVVWRWRG